MIEKLLELKFSIREIARKLGTNPSTISREMERSTTVQIKKKS